jgi:toxin YoeB
MIHFTQEAWEQYLYWQTEDKATLRKINILIKDCIRSPFRGLGKPEPLKRNLAGFWSRRIDDVNRLVYKYENEELFIISCRFHYKQQE